MRVFVLLVFLLLLGNKGDICFAQTTVMGKVVRILDGDTFELLVNGRDLYKVRLSDIDAPEKKQDFGHVAKQYLAALIFSKEVKVVYDKLDRNQRILGEVFCNGRNINLVLVQNGLAWHFVKYSKSKVYQQAEQQARKAGVGLWKHSNALPPWEFRQRR